MSKFKIGDKVRIKERSRWYDPEDESNPIDEIGVIEEIRDLYKNPDHYIEVKWTKGYNRYNDEDLELYEEKSNKQLAREYLYNTLTNKNYSIKTTLENREKFYKILDNLRIKYFNYMDRLLTTHKEVFSYYNMDELSQSSHVYPSVSVEIDFENILKEYKQILNK